MQRQLYFTTLDFLIQAIEAKEMEIDCAGEEVNRAVLETQMVNLQKRLHIEFCYLATFADGDGRAI